MFPFSKKVELPSRERALPGRPTAISTAELHDVFGRKLAGPYPAGATSAIFGMGCFWGAERMFWNLGGGGIVGDRCWLCGRLYA